MAALSLVRHIFLHLFSILTTTEVFSAIVTPRSDTQSIICTDPGYQYARHPLDCSRWFNCPHGQPVEMPACINSMAFSMRTLTCLSRKNHNNDCVSTCEFNGKLRYLGETFVGRNSCEKCICQNNSGVVSCSNVCLSPSASTCSYNERTYQAGQYFMYSDGCNTCLCEELGIIRCTDYKCRTNKVTCYHQEAVYVAGETFSHLDGHRTCTCRLDGVVFCSLFYAGQTEDEMSCLYDLKWRKAGTVFLSVDRCNQCECLDNSHVICTKFNCSSPKPSLNGYIVLSSVTPGSNSIASPPTTQIIVVCYHEKIEYRPGNIFTDADGCNTCSCSHAGKVHCTKKICSQPRVPQSNQQQTCFYAGQIYQLNSTDGCNICHCTRNGRVQCTELTCLPIWNKRPDQFKCIYGERVYREGESFFALDGCNYCSCGPYAQVECTARDCQSTPDTTMATTMPTLSATTTARPSPPTNSCFHKGKHYNVGETFSTRCDFCYCSLNRHVHCIRLLCPPESDPIPQHSLSGLFQQPNTPRETSTASEKNAPPSSSYAAFTKATNINSPKSFASDNTDSITEFNVQKHKSYSPSNPFTSESPPTSNQGETFEKSTVASLLESDTQHSANQTKNSYSRTLSTPSEIAFTTQLPNIIAENTTLPWNLDSKKSIYKLPSLFAGAQKKNNFESSKSETLLSNILPPSLLNFFTVEENPTNREVDYSKLISTDTPQTERLTSPTSITSNFVTLATVPKSDTITQKGVVAELQKAKINGSSTTKLEFLVKGTSDPYESTSHAITSTNTDWETQTVPNKSRDFVTLPGRSLISAGVTLYPETSTMNKAEMSSFSTETTNYISSPPDTVDFKSSFAGTTISELSPDVTAQPAPLSLPTLISTTNSISTPSPSVTIATPRRTTELPMSENSYTISIPSVVVLNKSKSTVNEATVSGYYTESSSKSDPEVRLPVSMKPIPPSSMASATQDRSPKSLVSLILTFTTSTADRLVSTAETGTSPSGSVHDTGSKTPQTMHFSIDPVDTTYISRKPRPFITNTPSITTTSVAGSPIDVFTTDTTATNSFNNPSSSSHFSSAATTMIPSKSISASSIQDTPTIPPTIDDTNRLPSDKQFDVTSSTITREIISNRSVNDKTTMPFTEYTRSTITRSQLKTNTPIYSISKHTSDASTIATNITSITKPILVTPVTRTDTRHFSELPVTDSMKVSKITLTTLKTTPVPTTTTNKAVLISSTFLKTSKPLLSHVINTPIVTSIKRIPLTKTNSALIPKVPNESTLALDQDLCYYNGRKYKIWDVFTSQDDCNTCECLYNGMTHCTDFPCHNQKDRILSSPTETMTARIATTTEHSPPAPALEVIPCFYNGMRYELWDVFSSMDDCNTCDCLYHGMVHCTNRQCASKNDIPVINEYSQMSIRETCKYKDQVLKIGQSFLSEDKCTICNCTIGGHISCTDIHCPSKNVQLNDQKSKLPDKVPPIPMVSRGPSISTASTAQKTTTTQKTIQATFVSRAFCWYNGLTYLTGDKFNSEDNCNTCTCTPDSLVTCTQLPCTSNNVVSDQSNCAYDGHIYQNGQMFSSADGCNTCGCLDDGIILCTSQVCRLGKDRFKVPVVTDSPVKCSYNGKMYNGGDVFNSTEDCNLCNCTQNGQVQCSQNACRQEPDRLQYDAPAKVPVAVMCSYEGRSYKPKQVFQIADGCNVCTCEDDGRIVCTNKKCLLNNNETRGRQNSAATFTTTTTIPLNQPSPKLCSYDGQTFQTGDTFSAIDGCNSCNCTINGEVQCSQRRCPLNIAGQSKTAESLYFHAGVTCVYEAEIYKPLQIFPSSDGCNTCKCSDVGKIHCTDKMCTAKSNDSKGKGQLVAKITTTSKVPILEKCSYNKQTYRVGDTFYSIDGCNLCNCSHKGVVKCDQKSCLPRNEEASKDVAMSLSANVGITCVYDGEIYQPQKVFPSIDGCNTCACSDAGQVHCTEAVCSEKKQPKDKKINTEEHTQEGNSGSCIFSGKRFIVGDTFDMADGCNICGCSDRGKILCTNRTCYPGILQNRESPQTVKATTPTPQVTRAKKILCHYNGHTYNSGRIFKAADSCNMCGCLLSGKVHCTKNICDIKIVQTTVPPRTSAVPRHIPLVKCRYFGQKYNVGQMFAVQDGCNKCACLPEGIVRCTKHRCDPPVVFCKHGGNVYFIGQTFADECNTCKCGLHGIITCTELHCANEDDGRCEYNGQEHELGDTFRSSDGCHLCTCSGNARISCRPIPCQVPRNRFGTSRERSEEEYSDD